MVIMFLKILQYNQLLLQDVQLAEVKIHNYKEVCIPSAQSFHLLHFFSFSNKQYLACMLNTLLNLSSKAFDKFSENSFIL